jgi:DNA-directed RNA polymerase specialized sigma24 family protein
MSPEQSHSVTLLIRALREDKPTSDPAAAEIWRRYTSTLMQLVHKRLSTRVKARTSPEYVVQDAFSTFFIHYRDGEYQVDDRSDLVRLLVGITMNKVMLAARVHIRTGKRSVLKESQPSSRNNDGEVRVHEPEARADPIEVSLEHAAIFEEVCTRGLGLLDEQHRQIVEMTIAGLTPEQIARELDLHVRSIQRKLVAIRQVWKENGIHYDEPA